MKHLSAEPGRRICRIGRGCLYLIISNHQSWVDIPALIQALNRHTPFFKFFLKKELIWAPFLGLAWLALDYPFMKHYSKSFLEKHPQLKGQGRVGFLGLAQWAGAESHHRHSGT